MRLGKVISIIKEKGFGFILSDLGENVFFHINDVGHNVYNNLKIDDIVYFESIKGFKGIKAISVVEESQYNEKDISVYPGLAKYINLKHVSHEEAKVINNLSKIFYITNGGSRINLGVHSEYKYFLLKPTKDFEEQFNIKREIVVIFSDYVDFQPRTLDAIDEVISRNQILRLDRVCSIIISRDLDIENKLSSILKNDTEMQVVIPFSYAELMTLSNKSIVINRFIKYFYERDLFAFEAPLTKDLYFFGRRDYVQTLLNRHLSNENSGVFGLRRSGKTSVLNAIIRSLTKDSRPLLLIDCQEIHFLRWNHALYEIPKRLSEQYNLDITINKHDYSENNASLSFSRDMIFCYDKLQLPVLLLFDEIEHITFDVSLSKHWSTDFDFIKFWQVLRAFFHGNPNKLHFIIAGTNPMSAETPLIKGYDNPLYNQLNTDSYINSFNVSQTKEMVNILGGYIGLYFDDYVCASLTQDMGGHPYLIRHFCSQINKFVIENSTIKKPIEITKTIYDNVKPIFEQQYSDEYCKLILNVLLTYYKEEYELLVLLATNYQSFALKSSEDPKLLTHLIGYGIVEKVGDMYSYKIDIIKKYLLEKNKYKKLHLSDEDKWAEISERRNPVELKLRVIVKNQLKSAYGITQAKSKILNTIENSKRAKYTRLSYDDLFNPNVCEIYFHQLMLAINNNWAAFKNIFTANQNTVKAYLTIINNLRSDCHAKSISESEMQSFRGAMDWLEHEITAYFI